MLPPFYYKNVSAEGLYRSFAQAIDRAGDSRVRVYLYHIPQVSQVAIPLGVIERLRGAFPGVVVGIKDSSGDFANTRAMLRSFPGFEVFVGSEKFLLANLHEGGAGCITATANVNAPAIARAFRERTEEAQREIDRVRERFDKLPLVAALKETVAIRTGDDSWRAVRPPLVELSPEERKLLKASESP
jgi:4-hydroxy-tetrahydrodipicolinate synthase